MISFDLAHHQERLAVVRGEERTAEVVLLVRALLAKVEQRDITHGDAESALRAVLAGLTGVR